MGNPSEPTRLGCGAPPGHKQRRLSTSGEHAPVSRSRRVQASVIPGRVVSSQPSRWQALLPPRRRAVPARRCYLEPRRRRVFVIGTPAMRSALAAKRPRQHGHGSWQRVSGAEGNASPHKYVSRLIGNSARCDPGMSPLFLRIAVFGTPQCGRWGRAVEQHEQVGSPFTPTAVGKGRIHPRALDVARCPSQSESRLRQRSTSRLHHVGGALRAPGP